MVGVTTGVADGDLGAAARLLMPAERSSLLWRGAAGAGGIIRLFGLPVSDTTVTDASRAMVEAARFSRRTRVVFANAHVINEMAARNAYSRVVTSADMVLADGSGMAVAAKLAGTPLADNVNGTDLFPRLAADAAKAGVKIFLIGGKPGTTAATAKRMHDFGLSTAIAGTHHGYFAPGSQDEADAVAKINASGAGIVLVGMGVPLQDEWIARMGDRLHAPVRVGVGGLFDFFAGSVSRAPHAMRVIGCEWVWRLALEPKRMARRYLIGNLTFLGLALRQAVRVRRERAAGTLSGQGAAPQVR